MPGTRSAAAEAAQLICVAKRPVRSAPDGPSRPQAVSRVHLQVFRVHTTPPIGTKAAPCRAQVAAPTVRV
jgi:hypothetical protein